MAARAPFTVHLSTEERSKLEAARERATERGGAPTTLSNIARALLVRACDAELTRSTEPPRAA